VYESSPTYFVPVANVVFLIGLAFVYSKWKTWHCDSYIALDS
jgi:hypothetical protein